MENQRIQEDEMEALQAIYGDDFQPLTTAGSVGPTAYSILVSSSDSRCVTVQVTCPEGYPTTSAPIYELRNSEWLDDNDILHIAEQLTQVYKDHEGEVVVYQLIECIRDYITSNINRADTGIAKQDIQTTAEGDEVTTMNASTFTTDLDVTEHTSEVPTRPNVEQHISESTNSGKVCGEEQCPTILHGEPLTDRKSTFQAHVAAVNTKQEVEAVIVELKKNKKIASATHNILAYRLLDACKGVLVQDCDDDGESAAGGRLLHLLQMMDVKNAVVVVSRWYGGILLHGDRFKHINNVARILLLETGVGLEQKANTAAKSVKTKGKRMKQ